MTRRRANRPKHTHLAKPGASAFGLRPKATPHARVELYRDKVMMPRGAVAVLAVLGVSLLTMGLIGLLTAVPTLAVLGIFGVPILGVISLLSVVRLYVTADELHIQIGLGGPRFPIEDIVRCVVLDPGHHGELAAREYPLKDGAYGLELHLGDGRIIHINRTTQERVRALASAIEQARQIRVSSTRAEVEPAEVTLAPSPVEERPG